MSNPLGQLIITIVVIPLMLIGCPSPKSSAENPGFSNLINDLEAAGFFKYVQPEEVVKIKETITTDGFLFPLETKRIYFADAENLAEQGVFDFVSAISSFLNSQNVHIPLRHEKGIKQKLLNPSTGEIIEVEPMTSVVDDSIPDEINIKYIRPMVEEFPESADHYTVTMGNLTQEIWNEDMSDVQCWEAAMCHTFILINKLLEKSGSQERIYGLYGGNEGNAVFLTSEQFEIIKNSPQINDADKPWVPYEVKPNK